MLCFASAKGVIFCDSATCNEYEFFFVKAILLHEIFDLKESTLYFPSTLEGRGEGPLGPLGPLERVDLFTSLSHYYVKFMYKLTS